MKEDNLRLISKGNSGRSGWMLGAKFTECVGSNNRHGLVVSRNPDGVTCQVHYFEDSTIEKQRSYYDIVELVFNDIRYAAVQNRQVKKWPTSSQTDSKQIQTSKRSNTTCVSSDDADAVTDTATLSSIAGKGGQGKEKMGITATLERLKGAFCLNPSELVSCASPFELHPSLGNSLWRALNSAEPDNGTSILTELLSVYSTVPGNRMSKQLFELLVDGPISEKHSYFDPNKSEVVAKYAIQIARKFPTGSIGPDWNAISRLYGRISNLNERASSIANHESFCALQQAACALEYILVLIENDLTMVGCLKGYDMKEALKERISFSFFLNPGGIRESLKLTAKTAMQFLIQNEQLHLERNNENGETDQGSAGAALRCLTAMGKLISLVSWLYCSSEGIDIEHNDLAFLLKDVIDAELSRASVKAAERKRPKLSFVLYLDLSDFASPLITRLSEILGLTKELSILTI